LLVNEKCKLITQVWQNLALINLKGLTMARACQVDARRDRLTEEAASFGFRAPYALSYPFICGAHPGLLVDLPFRLGFGP
jgi:hypothetical protein